MLLISRRILIQDQMLFYKSERIQDVPINYWQYIRAPINYGYYERTAAHGHQPRLKKEKKRKKILWPHHEQQLHSNISATLYLHCNDHHRKKKKDQRFTALV